MMTRPLAARAMAVAAALLASIWTASAQPAQTRTYEPPADPASVLATLNEPLSRIPEADSVEKSLFPAIAAMKARPGVVGESKEVVLSLFPGRPGWEEAKSWASAPEQQAVIEAVRKVGAQGARAAFTLPYGASAPEAYRKAGLWVDLGDPAVLSGAKFRYLDRLTNDVDPLVHLEATRLGAEGKPRQAAELLVSWGRVGRRLADREFYKEKVAGFAIMITVLERVRDVVRTYLKDVAEQDTIDLIGELENDKVQIERIRLPEGDRLAALQLAALTISPRGRPNAETFGPTMARLAAGDRPLQLFGQAAWWQRVADNHADWFDVQDRLKAIFEDWHFRWGQPDHEKIHQQPTDFSKADRARMAIFIETIPDFEALRRMRLALMVELPGTRLALGVVGYELRNKTLPAVLTAVRGRYVKKVDFDPLEPTLDAPFRYFVPIRDQPQDARKGPQPHVIRVRTGDLLQAAILQTMLTKTTMMDEKQGLFVTEKDVTDVAVENAAMDSAARMTPEQLKGPKGPLAFMKELAAKKVTRDNVSEKLPELVGLSELIGPLTNKDAKFKDLLGDYMSALLADHTFESVYSKVRAGKEPTEEELRSSLGAMVKVSTHSIAGLGRNKSTGISGPSFDVSLDDKSFVLYSVGGDGKAEWAKNVGVGGSDMLIWPPLLSLMRENAYPVK